MIKKTILPILFIFAIVLTGCNDDEVKDPSYSAISIYPEKETYKVGDVIKCSIMQTDPNPQNLKETTYWWYASWWFNDSAMTPDFQEFDNNVCESAEITLTQPGDVTIYFFGQLKYRHYDWHKIEVARTIKVTE